MKDREPVEAMIAEAFREVGVLTFVFAILDKIVAGSITIGWTVAAIASAAGFFSAGCFLERRRKIG